MRLLFIEWNSFGNEYFKKELIKNNITVIEYKIESNRQQIENIENSAAALAKSIIDNQVDCIFSFNYFDYIAIAANACKRLYISWTYDSPYVQLFSKTISLPTNLIFSFDREIVNKLNTLGAQNVYHLPLCAPVSVYDSIKLTNEDITKYSSDISLIGSTYYEEKNNLYERYIQGDDYLNGYIEGILCAQKSLFGMSILEACLNDDILSQIGDIYRDNPGGMETKAWVIANYVLARRLTAIERHDYMALLGNNFKNVSLYTNANNHTIENVRNCGALDYYLEMPLAMKCSKINLNITLRSIVNAVPLRVFDIFACNSFCLSSYQSELLEYFTPGEDFDYYDSEKMLIDKCDYYLKNEKERIEIADNAHKKVQKYHTYKNRVETILEYIG